MKNKIVVLGQWGQKHWLQLIIIMSILMMIFYAWSSLAGFLDIGPTHYGGRISS